MNKLIEILTNVRPDIDFLQNNQLIDDGVLDSFDIIMLIGELNEEFDIKISVEDLVPENFNSADAMMKLIKILQDD